MHKRGRPMSKARPRWSTLEDTCLRQAVKSGYPVCSLPFRLQLTGGFDHERTPAACKARACALGLSLAQVSRWTREERAKARALLEAGKTCKQAASELHSQGYPLRSAAAIRAAVRVKSSNWRLPKEPNHHWTAAQVVKLRAIKAKGLTWAQVAEELNATKKFSRTLTAAQCRQVNYRRK